MNVFVSRFPNQGICGGGMIVIAENYDQAVKLLRKKLEDHDEVEDIDDMVDALTEIGPASNTAYSFYTD